jgi:protein TonB
LCAVVILLSAANGLPSAIGQDRGHAPGATKALSDDFVAPRLIKRVDAVYPDVAAADRVNGDVVMKSTIAADGTVQNIQVVHGLPQLIRIAVHAYSQWRFEPARINGVASPLELITTMHFKVGKGPAETEFALLGSDGVAVPVAAPSGRPPLPPPPPGVPRISGRVMEGLIETKVDPVYPPDSIALDAQGLVVVLATIDTTGAVSNVQAVSGPTRFRDAAVAAVKQWHYRPYEVDGKPVVVQTPIALNFAPPR